VAALVILDTNVISEMSHERPDPIVSAWFLGQEAGSLYTTAVTLAEVLYGLNLVPAGKRRDRLVELSHTIFETGLRGKVLAFDEMAARHYARIRSSKHLKGLAMSAFDAQIAAIALATGASVATRNVTDFEHCGIAVINPWIA
jgi:predicted nucleic acid-binding protein